VGPRTDLYGYGEERISYPTAVRTQNCPACGELLCRLQYPRPIRDVSRPKFDVKTSQENRNDMYEEARNTTYVSFTSFTYVYDSLIV
jgi:hypothetical protein